MKANSAIDGPGRRARRRRKLARAYARCRQFLLVAVALWAAVSAAAEDLRLEPLAPNVWAVLQPAAGRFDDANSLIVVGDEAAAVVDAQARPAGLAQAMNYVRQVSDVPLRYLINTHWHADHTQGNARYRQQFGAQVHIVGHDSLFDDVPDRAAKGLRERVERVSEILERAEREFAAGNDEQGEPLADDAVEQQRAGIERTRRWLEANRGAKFLTPSVSYRDRLVLDLGGTRLELLHFRAHTRGDTVVWLPDRRILASGDLLDDLPYAGHGYPKSWRASLERIGELGAQIVVPGHGPVLRDDAKRRAIVGFLDALILSATEPGPAAMDATALAESGRFNDARGTLAGADPAAQKFFDAVLVEAIERTRETLDAGN